MHGSLRRIWLASKDSDQVPSTSHRGIVVLVLEAAWYCADMSMCVQPAAPCAIEDGMPSSAL